MMRKFIPSSLILFGILVCSCTSKFFEKCPTDHIVGDWGVVNDTHTFGGDDSIYYLINPIGDLSDSAFYNGDYSDSYYHSDSIRVMLRYTMADSIYFNIDRMYAVQTNPQRILMKVSQEADSLHINTTLLLNKVGNNDRLFCCGPDSTFREMLIKGRLMMISATNTTSAAEPQGSQDYSFIINPKGFTEAVDLAMKLNARFTPKDSTDSTLSTDTVKPLHKKKF